MDLTNENRNQWPDNIRRNMSVYGASGELIGEVVDVLQPAATAAGTTGLSPTSSQSGQGFLKVKTPGLMGLGAVNPEALWIPINLVRHVDQENNRLTVNLTKIEAEDKYDSPPGEPGYGI